jgi:hypothetical protein
MHCPRRALCALLLALALASAGAAAAKAPAAGGRPSEPLFDADALRALSARLEEMARDVERALASNSSSAAAAAKLEYLQDALHVRHAAAGALAFHPFRQPPPGGCATLCKQARRKGRGCTRHGVRGRAAQPACQHARLAHTVCDRM